MSLHCTVSSPSIVQICTVLLKANLSLSLHSSVQCLLSHAMKLLFIAAYPRILICEQRRKIVATKARPNLVFDIESNKAFGKSLKTGSQR